MPRPKYRNSAVTGRSRDAPQVGGDAKIASMPSAHPCCARIGHRITKRRNPVVKPLVPRGICRRIEVTQPVGDRPAVIELVLGIDEPLRVRGKRDQFTRSTMRCEPLPEIIVVVRTRCRLQPVDGIDPRQVQHRRAARSDRLRRR